MRFIGEATGSIAVANGRLCLIEEKTGFKFYFSISAPETLKRVEPSNERVRLIFEPVLMRSARVRPVQIERCPEEYRPPFFEAAFETESLVGADMICESSYLRGTFFGDDTLCSVDLGPFDEAFLYSALYEEGGSAPKADVIAGRFIVREDWDCDFMYMLNTIEYCLSAEDWLKIGKSSLALPSSCQHEDNGSPKSNGSPIRRKPISSRLRYEILLRDGHRCVDCGASALEDPLVRLEVDHRVPVSKGGTNERENLQTLCWACNNGKSDQLDHKLQARKLPYQDPWALAA